MTGTVDLTPIYQTVNEGAGLIFVGIAGWVLAWGRKFILEHLRFLGQKTDALLATGLNTALQNGTAIALHEMQAWESVHKDVAVKGMVQRWAAQYAIGHAKEAVDHFGLNPDKLAIKALAYLPRPPLSPAQEVATTAELNREQITQ